MPVDDPRTSTSGRSPVFGDEYPQPRYTGSVDEPAVYLDQYDLGLVAVVTNLIVCDAFWMDLVSALCKDSRVEHLG